MLMTINFGVILGVPPQKIPKNGRSHDAYARFGGSKSHAEMLMTAKFEVILGVPPKKFPKNGRSRELDRRFGGTCKNGGNFPVFADTNAV
jgi:hypothetical protein